MKAPLDLDVPEAGQHIGRDGRTLVAMRRPLAPPPIRFTVADVDRAYDAWNFNCGHAAVCAVTGKTPDELRPHLCDFEQKGYTNPTLMFAILRELGVAYTATTCRGDDVVDFPNFGLARIQWGGPWTNPGVPMRARYRQTHWVASCRDPQRGLGIFDVNCMNNGSGWVSFENWEKVVVPSILEGYPRADGDWWVTHEIEVLP